jgi:hypothetical protein
VLVVATVGATLYTRFPHLLPGGRAAEAPADVAPFVAPDDRAGRFRCEGKAYCSQMTSCEEAKFCLDNCPGVKIDGDGDGIPCERQHC